MNGLLLSALLLAASGFRTPQDFLLPDGAVKIDEDRYRLAQTWDEAIKFYRQTYPAPKFPRRTLHSESQVRAVHIQNRGGGRWEGVNLYETPRGEVRIYVLQAPPPPGPPAKSK